MEIKDVDDINSPFHSNLNGLLDSVTENLQQALAGITSDTVFDEEENSKITEECLSQAKGDFNTVLGNFQAFLTCINVEATNLHYEAEDLADQIKDLEFERDALNEKGHELHCRIGYNALEKLLEDSLYDMGKHTSLQSAKCFTDEAKENVKRSQDLVRLANLRSCQLDTDIFKQAEGTAQLFERYEKERAEYVKELDLLDDAKRSRLSGWLDGTLEGLQCDEDQKKVKDTLEYLSLSRQHRHLNAEVIKAALRMHSLNSSLNFDRKANMDRLEQLSGILQKVNELTGIKVTLPRPATARTDLTSSSMTDVECENTSEGDVMPRDNASADENNDVRPPVTCVGQELHKCPKNFNLATDPITDPDLLARLESALRWEQNDGASVGVKASDTKLQESAVTLTEARALDHVESAWYDGIGKVATRPHTEDSVEEGMALKNANLANRDVSAPCPPQNTATIRTTKSKSYAFQHHMESANLLPDSAETHMEGLVMKKPTDGRPVSSLD